MVRRMIATITQIESVVTPSGNSGHVVVPKARIGKEAIVTLKDSQAKAKKRTLHADVLCIYVVLAVLGVATLGCCSAWYSYYPSSRWNQIRV
jgi:putative transposon-encoded protein